jgi:DNA-binding transcriptional regulator YhcF (GntR family)
MKVNDIEENYKTGWISLYRSISNHWLWKDPVKLQWWLIMLFEANHSKNKIVLGYDIYEIEKGQSANSLRTWANLFNSNTKTVSKFFILLEKDKMITREIIGKGKRSTTLINITRYSDYQGVRETQETTLKTTLKTTQGKRNRDTNNNGNNYNNDNNEINIEERKLKFADTLKPFLDNYSKSMIADFYSYWTEPNKSNTKFKQELQKTWDVSRRLKKWSENNFGNQTNKSKGGMVY